MHSTFGTTENSVGEYPDAVGTYEVALATLWEYGQFDDIIQDSPSQADPVGEQIVSNSYVASTAAVAVRLRRSDERLAIF
jgi:hypothetical protein